MFKDELHNCSLNQFE